MDDDRPCLSKSHFKVTMITNMFRKFLFGTTMALNPIVLVIKVILQKKSSGLVVFCSLRAVQKMYITGGGGPYPLR